MLTLGAHVRARGPNRPVHRELARGGALLGPLRIGRRSLAGRAGGRGSARRASPRLLLGLDRAEDAAFADGVTDLRHLPRLSRGPVLARE